MKLTWQGFLAKVTSRKWQAALFGSLLPIVVRLNMGGLEWWQALSMSVSILSIYILVEGHIDAKRIAVSVTDAIAPTEETSKPEEKKEQWR